MTPKIMAEACLALLVGSLGVDRLAYAESGSIVGWGSDVVGVEPGRGTSVIAAILEGPTKASWQAEPPNDRCTYPLPLSAPAAVVGTTLEATPDSVEPCGADVTGPGVWYMVQGTGGTLRVTTCTSVTDFDTKISVYCGDCASLTCVAGNDDDAQCDEQGSSTVAWCSQPGATYLVLIHGHESGGSFGLLLSDDQDACTGVIDCGSDAGACCYPFEGLCRVGTEEECHGVGEVFAEPGTSCYAGFCLDACCNENNGYCRETSEAWCLLQEDSVYYGMGTSCDDIVCGGACCTYWGECDQTGEEACAGYGTFQGSGSTCEELFCGGACCMPWGDCWYIGEQACLHDGDVFHGLGTSCEDVVCRGACCLYDGCAQQGRGVCEDNYGGVFQGYGTSCTDTGIPCTTGVGACCLVAPWAYEPCLDGVTALECALFSGGAYRGDGSTCVDANCPGSPCPGIGTCCEAHRWGGCEDGDCCAIVCTTDPLCCLAEWDGICVAEATRWCGRIGGQPGTGDVNGDGYVDLYDFHLFHLRFAGCGSNLLPCPCGVSADLNDDGRTDLRDVALFQLRFGSPR